MSDVGRFMFGVGALIELQETGKFLIMKRESKAEWNKEKWELIYGRKSAVENIDEAVKREVFEETGISDFEILKPLRFWHFFRGAKIEEKEILGITFHCRVQSSDVEISAEHETYEWVTPEEALAKIDVKGICLDIQKFMSKESDLWLSNTDENLWKQN